MRTLQEWIKHTLTFCPEGASTSAFLAEAMEREREVLHALLDGEEVAPVEEMSDPALSIVATLNVNGKRITYRVVGGEREIAQHPLDENLLAIDTVHRTLLALEVKAAEEVLQVVRQIRRRVCGDVT